MWEPRSHTFLRITEICITRLELWDIPKPDRDVWKWSFRWIYWFLDGTYGCHKENSLPEHKVSHTIPSGRKQLIQIMRIHTYIFSGKTNVWGFIQATWIRSPGKHIENAVHWPLFTRHRSRSSDVGICYSRSNVQENVISPTHWLKFQEHIWLVLKKSHPIYSLTRGLCTWVLLAWSYAKTSTLTMMKATWSVPLFANQIIQVISN